MSGVSRSEMPGWECQQLLAETSIGRLCVIDDGYPLAFPVNYQQVAGANPQGGVRHLLVVRTAPGATLARCEGLASLEIDQIDPVTRRAWSVIARGRLRRTSDVHDLPDPGPWIDDGRSQWVVLEVTATSGRRFHASTSDEGYVVDWIASND
jgi:uncharacterized protein